MVKTASLIVLTLLLYSFTSDPHKASAKVKATIVSSDEIITIDSVYCDTVLNFE